jgi:hypothetical protein
MKRFSPTRITPLSTFCLLSLLSLRIAYAGTEYNASSFNLIGPDGRVTAQLTSSVEGTPAIFFYDENHNVRLNMGIYPGGAPGVILMDKEGNASAILRLTDDGKTPVLVLKENGVDKKIIGLGQYAEKENTSSVITTPIKTKEERKNEYFIFGVAFCFALIGSYFGGRIASVERRKESQKREAPIAPPPFISVPESMKVQTPPPAPKPLPQVPAPALNLSLFTKKVTLAKPTKIHHTEETEQTSDEIASAHNEKK